MERDDPIVIYLIRKNIIAKKKLEKILFFDSYLDTG